MFRLFLLGMGCGAIPKDIPATDQAKAYEAGGVDVGSTAISSYLGRKLYRFMDTVTRTNHAYVEFVVVINEKFWAGLTESQRSILTSAADAAGRLASDRVMEIENTVYTELEKRFGVKVVNLTTDELISWRICSSDVVSAFLDRAGQPGQELMEAYGRQRSGACCKQTELLGTVSGAR